MQLICFSVLHTYLFESIRKMSGALVNIYCHIAKKSFATSSLQEACISTRYFYDSESSRIQQYTGNFGERKFLQYASINVHSTYSLRDLMYNLVNLRASTLT